MQALHTLSMRLGAALQARQYQLALAESCTGGLVAQWVTEIAGSSAWFDRGFVTYSNVAKQSMLGVPATLIAQHGAVSVQVAEAMAAGALAHSQASIAAAITGIAGPGGGSAFKPVGTVCFAWAIRLGARSRVISDTHHFAGDRSQVREQAAMVAMAGLLEMLEATAD